MATALTPMIQPVKYRYLKAFPIAFMLDKFIYLNLSMEVALAEDLTTPPTVHTRKRQKARALAESRSPLPVLRLHTNGDEEERDDEQEIDEMLEELGIPNSGKKKKTNEVIELITPPKNTWSQTKENRRSSTASIVDLTSPTDGFVPSSAVDALSTVESASVIPARRPLQERFEASVTMTTESIISVSDDESPTTLLSAPVMSSIMATTSVLRTTARSLQGIEDDNRLDKISEKHYHKKKRRYETDIVDGNGRSTRATMEKQCTAAKPIASMTKTSAVAVVRMDRAMASSNTGKVIIEALENNVYNNKKVPFIIEAPFDCMLPFVIQWERRDTMVDGLAVSTGFTVAIIYEADRFLNLLEERGYSDVLEMVHQLQKIVRTKVEKEKRVLGDSALIDENVVVVVEGMDTALIRHKKTKQSNRNSQSNACILTFADLHELAFQLFMDTEVHTKFTCDLEATASYLAILTREIVVSANKASVQEEYLESVPRLHSFRVTSTGATMNSYANVWLRMLQMIPGVSEDKAQSLLNHFPTFESLMRAYSDPNMSQEEKEDLLCDKMQDSRIERALSRRVFNALFVDDHAAHI